MQQETLGIMMPTITFGYIFLEFPPFILKSSKVKGDKEKVEPYLKYNVNAVLFGAVVVNFILVMFYY